MIPINLIKNGLSQIGKTASSLQKGKTDRISKVRGWSAPILALYAGSPFPTILWLWVAGIVLDNQEWVKRAVEFVNSIGQFQFFSIIMALIGGTAYAIGSIGKKKIEIADKQHEREQETIKEISKNEKGFDFALQHILKNEGGYVDDPDDRGGETYRGISRKNFPEWLGWKFIDRYRRHLNKEKKMNKNEKLQEFVKQFYYDKFWLKNKCDKIEKMSDKISLEIFDTAINCGSFRAITFLQKTINLLGNGINIETSIDGKIGNITIEKLDLLLPKYERAIYASLNYFQAKHYIDICEKNNSQYKYIRGWLTRASENPS